MARTHKEPSMTRKSYLGDWIESALSSVGITSEKVSKWIGKPCSCPERRDKLNAFHLWLERVVKGKYSEDKDTAQRHLEVIMQSDEDEQEQSKQEKRTNTED